MKYQNCFYLSLDFIISVEKIEAKEVVEVLVVVSSTVQNTSDLHLV